MAEVAINSTAPTGRWDENTEDDGEMANPHSVHNHHCNMRGVIPPWTYVSSAQATGYTIIVFPVMPNNQNIFRIVTEWLLYIKIFLEWNYKI